MPAPCPLCWLSCIPEARQHACCCMCCQTFILRSGDHAHDTAVAATLASLWMVPRLAPLECIPCPVADQNAAPAISSDPRQGPRICCMLTRRAPGGNVPPHGGDQLQHRHGGPHQRPQPQHRHAGHHHPAEDGQREQHRAPHQAGQRALVEDPMQGTSMALSGNYAAVHVAARPHASGSVSGSRCENNAGN